MTAKVFDSAFMVMVRSRSPGSDAGLTCLRPSKTKCSYTSSVKMNRSRSRAIAPSASSSTRVNTFPEGFPGVFTTIARVRVVRAISSSPSGSANSGP